MHMKAPKLVFERREDQTVHANLDQLQPSEVSEPIDWWAEIQQYVQKLQQWNEQYRKVEERIPEDKLTQSSREVATQKRSPFKVDYSRRVTYPFEQRANFVAISLLGEGLEIEFVDSASQSRGHAAIPPLKNGRILIEHVSDNPAQHHEPIRWTLTGDIAGAPIKLAGILDERLKRPGANQAVPSHLSLDFHAEGLPAELVQFFAGSSLPMHFEEGSITLAGTLSMDGWNELNVRPVFGFRDVVVSPQAGSQSIVGVSPEVFCRAMNEVGTLEISDLRITGTVANPRVKTGDTLANLVRSGGKAFAKKQIAKGMQMGTEKITQAVDEELDKLNANGTLPPEMGKAVDQVKKGLGDRLKGLPFGEKPGAARK
jgi:hypothetical protein